MGRPVVHFEIVGKDDEMLKRYYTDLFGWQIDSSNPMNYGIVQTGQGTSGGGIEGGIGGSPEDYAGHVTFYVDVDDVEAALTKAEGLGGRRVMGPEKVMDRLEVGLFTDPEGHLIGVVSS